MGNTKLANPAPLGLMGFGMTTVLLNFHNAGFYPMDTMILAMGIFYGGIAQVIAGVQEWKMGNTFGATAFTSYGFFWLTLVGLIALSGILMRNTLILIGQIRENEQAGLDPFHALVEATVQRARPVILTALAAILAFIPLTHSVFWGTLAYTLIGGTFAGTILTLVFLPAMYSIWSRIQPG